MKSLLFGDIIIFFKFGVFEHHPFLSSEILDDIKRLSSGEFANTSFSIVVISESGGIMIDFIFEFLNDPCKTALIIYISFSLMIYCGIKTSPPEHLLPTTFAFLFSLSNRKTS